MKTVLVMGASGATGRLLVQQLLNGGVQVRAVVRTPQTLPAELQEHPGLTLIQASLLDLTDAELLELVQGCDGVASCLGHNLSFRGVYGQPRRLVTDATRRVCQAIRVSGEQRRVKFVLMNTTGNRNRDLNEKVSLAQSLVIGLLRILLPPHVDNEQAADYLRTQVGQADSAVEWVVVRPDGLLDEQQVSDYRLYPSPIRSAIFDAGETSRVNVAHFMARLVTDSDCWDQWRGRMPVIYNQASCPPAG